MTAPSLSGRSSPMNELLDANGITYRQLQYWSERGLFGESNRSVGSGAKREFDDDDLRVMRVLGRLSRTVGLGRGPRSALGERLVEIVQKVRANELGLFMVAPGVVLDLGSLARPLELGELS